MKQVIRLTEQDIKRLVMEAFRHLNESEGDNIDDITDIDSDDIEGQYSNSNEIEFDPDKYLLDKNGEPIQLKPTQTRKPKRNGPSIDSLISDWVESYYNSCDNPGNEQYQEDERQKFGDLVDVLGHDQRIAFTIYRKYVENNAKYARQGQTKSLRQIDADECVSIFYQFMYTDHSDVKSSRSRVTKDMINNPGYLKVIDRVHDDLKDELAGAFELKGVKGFWDTLINMFATYSSAYYERQIENGGKTTNAINTVSINNNPSSDVDSFEEKEPKLSDIMGRIVDDYKHGRLEVPQGVRFSVKCLHCMYLATKQLERHPEMTQELNTTKKIQMLMYKIAYKIYCNLSSSTYSEQVFQDMCARTLKVVQTYFLPKYSSEMYQEMNEAKRRRRLLNRIINETISRMLLR